MRFDSCLTFCAISGKMMWIRYHALRTFCQGGKVAAEIALMAADAGLVCTADPVIAIAGTGCGADTAVVLKPANAQTFFDLKFLEIICMPSPGHPQSRERRDPP